MDGCDRVIKHLEIIQGVINRLANNSFLIKSWSMTILVAIILFLSRSDSPYSVYLVLSFSFPVIGFWVLDGYFLWQERLFRGIYNDVRNKADTDFNMDMPSQLKKPNNRWINSVFSVTLIIFYFIELSFLGIMSFILTGI